MTVPTPAASVLLANAPESHEVLLVKRADSLRAFGGFYAFPGGKIDAADSQLVLVGEPSPGIPASQYVGAFRELFEETGILLARDESGECVADASRHMESRARLMAGELDFAAFLSQNGLRLHTADLTPLGSLTTPTFAPHRFETRFFAAARPSEQRVDVWPGELSEGDFRLPGEMLDRWHGGELLLSPPTIIMLRALHGHPLVDAGLRLEPLWLAHASVPVPPLYYAPHMRIIPLRCHSIPPATHTNAIVMGNDPCYLFDPGSTYPEEQAILFGALDEHLAAGGRLSALVLTHHHPDHIGAVAACVERYRLPVFAHPWTATKLGNRFQFARLLHDGDELDMGTLPNGRSGKLVVLHTPGHAPGHLAFYDPEYRILLAADLVSPLTSIVIAPPEGNLAVYLETLKRVRSLPCRLLVPSHGNPTAQAGKLIDDTVTHRLRRQEQVAAALTSEPRTVGELTQELYNNLSPKLAKFAEWQMLAGLEMLRDEGRAERTESGAWRKEPRTE